MSGRFISVPSPTKSDASTSARNAFSLKRATRTTKPTTARPAKRSNLVCSAVMAARSIGASNRQPPFACRDLPSLDGATSADHHGLRMQRDRRADVARNTKQRIADLELRRTRRFDHEMLLAVSEEGCVFQPKEAHPRMWILRRD